MRIKHFVALVLLWVCLFSFMSCSSSTSDSKKSNKSSPDAGKTLTVYAGLDEAYAKKATEEFEKDTGIKVNMIRMSGGEILGKIKAEKEQPRASVWYGGPADSFIQAKDEGLIEAYKSPNAEKISDQVKDKDGYWTGIYRGYLGFISNKKLIADAKIEAPKSWEDLLKPELKGQITVANPETSGTAYTMVSTLVQLKGENDGFEYLKKLKVQVKSFVKSGSGPINLASEGQCMVGIAFLHDGIKTIKAGKDLVLSAPSEGTGYEIGATAMIKNAPEKEAAKKFIDWALTAKAQEIGQTAGLYQFLTAPGAKEPKEAELLKDTKLINYDVKWSGDNKNKLLEKWKNTVMK